MNDTELKIWFAGFYEGEGSISNDIGNGYRLRLSISQNDKTPLEIGQKKWKGHIRKRVRKSCMSDKICTGHEWVLNHKEALSFVNDIKPYMLIPYKKNQLADALEKYKNRDKFKRKFKCNFCDKEYASPSGKRRHEKKEHIKKGEEFECSNKFDNKDKLNKHFKSHNK